MERGFFLLHLHYTGSGGEVGDLVLFVQLRINLPKEKPIASAMSDAGIPTRFGG